MTANDITKVYHSSYSGGMREYYFKENIFTTTEYIGNLCFSIQMQLEKRKDMFSEMSVSLDFYLIVVVYYFIIWPTI